MNAPNVYPLADSEGGGRGVRPPKKTQKKQINTEKLMEKKANREREERFSLFASKIIIITCKSI